MVSHGAVVEASTDTLFTGLEHLGMMGEDVFGQSEEFPSCFDFASLKIPQQKSLAGNAIDAQVLGTFTYYVFSETEVLDVVHSVSSDSDAE